MVPFFKRTWDERFLASHGHYSNAICSSDWISNRSSSRFAKRKFKFLNNPALLRSKRRLIILFKRLEEIPTRRPFIPSRRAFSRKCLSSFGMAHFPMFAFSFVTRSISWQPPRSRKRTPHSQIIEQYKWRQDFKIDQRDASRIMYRNKLFACFANGQMLGGRKAWSLKFKHLFCFIKHSKLNCLRQVNVINHASHSTLQGDASSTC